jgi:Trypsin-co-occurring domain 1
MSNVRVEVVPRGTGGDLAGRRPEPEPYEARAGELADGIVYVAVQMRDRLDEMRATAARSWRLDTVEVQFGLAVQAEAGLIVARASAGATFTATLTWSAVDVATDRAGGWE